MLRNWLMTALRNIGRHRLYSFINIVGLAVGLACAVFIVLFIRDELSWDKWLPNTANLYRMEMTYRFPGRPPEGTAGGPWPLAPAMKMGIPEVAGITRLLHEPMTVKAGNRQFSEVPAAVDPNFFGIVPLPLVSGDAKTVFADPESVVVSQSVARKYFGRADPIGKTILLQGKYPLTVTGVMRDLPYNTQLDATILFSRFSRAENFPFKDSWFGADTFAYLRLVPGADPKAVIAKTEAILRRDVDMSVLLKARIPADQAIQVHLTPFADVHMTPYPFDEKPGGSWTMVYGFGVIAVLVLLIACFNFMNLATARAMLRSREVSMRKVLGAARWQLIAQFLGESVLIALLALAIALTATEVLLPAFDRLIGRPIAYDCFTDWPLSLLLVAIAATAGALGGFYPALVLSGFRPAATLKANAHALSGNGWLRVALVVVQFAISIGLGAAALVVQAQVRYAQSLDLGFDRYNILLIGNADRLDTATRDAMTKVIAQDPAVSGAALSDAAPFGEGSYSSGILQAPGNPQEYDIRSINAGPDFFQVYKIGLLAGRNLTTRPADLAPPHVARATALRHFNVIVNRTAARRLGYTPQSAIGKVLTQGHARLTVVGVVGDTKYAATRDTAEPIYYFNRPADMRLISVRVRPGHAVEAAADVDRVWHQFAPQEAIDRHFLDDSFDKLFQADQQESAMFGIFVAIAIFIACLGLFGLAAFTAERRTKEIGVRKVFGAKTRDVVRLLLWQFSIPVLIANAIAWPIAWYSLHGWLEGFAYRITLGPTYFIAAGAAALVIAWLTVIGHSLVVARANPVRALRYE